MKSETIWFAVDENGKEYVFGNKPIRLEYHWGAPENTFYTHLRKPLSIQAITGKKLSWEDEPLEWQPECKCSFVMVMRDSKTGIGYCSHCGKMVD